MKKANFTKTFRSRKGEESEEHAATEEIWLYFNKPIAFKALRAMVKNIGPRASILALETCKKGSKPFAYWMGIYKRIYKDIWKPES